MLYIIVIMLVWFIYFGIIFFSIINVEKSIENISSELDYLIRKKVSLFSSYFEDNKSELDDSFKNYLYIDYRAVSFENIIIYNKELDQCINHFFNNSNLTNEKLSLLKDNVISINNNISTNIQCYNSIVDIYNHKIYSFLYMPVVLFLRSKSKKRIEI